MSELVVSNLRAAVGDTEILHGVDLSVRSGEVHVVMGPNGSGKSTLSHVLMGRPGYRVLGGTATLDGTDLLGLETWQRAHAGLFLALQYPTEVPGVHLGDLLAAAATAQGGDPTSIDQRLMVEAERIGFDPDLIDRPLNVDLSGGEKKRNETLQLAVIEPRIAILDELDSGLDIDALRACARRVEALTNEDSLGVLAITHYTRLLHELRADRIHIMVAGRIVQSGGPELADELEADGYGRFSDEGDDGGTGNGAGSGPVGPSLDPFADPLV